MKNCKKTSFLTQSAIIASLYTLLVIVQNSLPLQTASGNIQFRVAEALTMLCVLTPSAVSGLTIGCLIGNITYISVMPPDCLFGTLATLISSFLCHKLRNIRVKGIPLLSALMPVIFNGVIIGAELTVFTARGEEKGIIITFFTQFLLVSAGEALSVFLLGIPLEKALEKRKIFN